MFIDACNEVRECIYGLNGFSIVGVNQITFTAGSGFMIAPGVIATAAHFCHIENDSAKALQTNFEVIRSPDVGQPMETATLIAEDPVRDIALLRIQNPRSESHIALLTDRVVTGTACGSLGFPLATVQARPSGRSFNLIERFQGANVSAYHSGLHPSGRELSFYETDRHMYSGSSGCPAFIESGEVFAIHVASQADPTAGRIAISLWVPAGDIRDFAVSNGISV